MIFKHALVQRPAYGPVKEDRINMILDDKKAVIFDLDGTLVDSMWMWGAIDVEFLARYGLECPEDLQGAIQGMSFSETAAYFKQRFGLETSPEQIKDAWVEMSIDKYRKEVPLKPGAREFLDHVKGLGLEAGIATSNGRAMVDVVLDALDISGYFAVVATACEVAAGKPAPDIYLEVARRLHVDPAHCVVFEDIPEGILAGRRAGMTVVAVEDAFSMNQIREKKEMADLYIRDYYDLLDGAAE